jgi:hypothetical protein
MTNNQQVRSSESPAQITPYECNNAQVEKNNDTTIPKSCNQCSLVQGILFFPEKKGPTEPSNGCLNFSSFMNDGKTIYILRGSAARHLLRHYKTEKPEIGPKRGP